MKLALGLKIDLNDPKNDKEDSKMGEKSRKVNALLSDQQTNGPTDQPTKRHS